MEQIAPAETQWSAAVEAAGWIAAALAPFEDGPGRLGDPAGLRGLRPGAQPGPRRPGQGHPAGALERDRAVERRPAAPGLAVPLDRAARPPGRPGRRPGTARAPSAAAWTWPTRRRSSSCSRPHTSTPGSCLFCLWDGWGWDTAMYVALPGEPPIPAPRPGAARGQVRPPGPAARPRLPALHRPDRRGARVRRLPGPDAEPVVARRPRLVRGLGSRPVLELRRRPGGADRRADSRIRGWRRCPP